MESKMENITEMKSERVEKSTEKEIETTEQSQDNVKETENINTGETVGEEASVIEQKDIPRDMLVEECTSLTPSKGATMIEEGTCDDDPQKIDDDKTQDKKNSQFETSSHLTPSPSVALDHEEGLAKPSVQDTVEHNVGSSEVSLENDRDSVMVDKDTAVVIGETTTIPETKLSEEKGSPRHHAITGMEQEKVVEKHDMISSGDHNEYPNSSDTKIPEDIGSPHHYADNVMGQDKVEEKHEMIASGDHNEFPGSPDTKLPDDIGSPHHYANTVMGQDKAAENNDLISSKDHNESPGIPDTKLAEDIGSPHHHVNTVMEQKKAAEKDDNIYTGDHNDFPASLDTKLAEDIGAAHHHVNTVMEEEKAEDEHEVISSGDHNESPNNPDTKVDEENNVRIDEGEPNNMNLADHGSGPPDHDQGTTTELNKEPEVPASETVSKLENKLAEPLIETSMNVENEPEMPATENLTGNDKNSDFSAAEVSEDTDKGLSLLPAIQISSDHNQVMATVEAEPSEGMELDIPDSIADANIGSNAQKDVNVEAVTNPDKEGMATPESEPTDDMKLDIPDSKFVADAIVGSNADKKDNSNNIDNESAIVRDETGHCVASSNMKSEVGVSGDLNNGVNKIDLAPPDLDGSISVKHLFLLDDMSEGYESGTEEDQSAFMKELDHFYRERNMEFRHPKFYGEGLNCLKLWRAVIRLGGYDKVTGSKLWRQVGESFRPPKTCTTVSWTFRGFYEKALLEYERHKVNEGELQIPLASEPEPMNIDNQASGSGRARRDSAARAMQGWHSQRNGNGEVSDLAKDKSLVLHQKREKQIGSSTPGSLKRKRQSSDEHGAKNAIQVFKPTLDVTVVDVGPPAYWVKINVKRTKECFEVYALVPGLSREEVRVQSDPAGRLVISGEPENPTNPWGATPFKKVVNLPTRIDPHHTSAVVTLNGQLFVRVPIEQSD